MAEGPGPPKLPDFLSYLPSMRAVLCRDHRLCFHRESIGKHLKAAHSITTQESKQIVASLQDLDIAENSDGIHLPADGDRPIEGVPILNGFACRHPGCRFRSTSVTYTQVHCAAEHGWNSQTQQLPYSAINMQSVFGAGMLRRYFIVQEHATQQAVKDWAEDVKEAASVRSLDSVDAQVSVVQPQFLVFLPDARAVLCREHGACLHRQNLNQHLQEAHRMGSYESRKTAASFKECNLAEGKTGMRLPFDGSDPIEGLPVFDGFACKHAVCRFRSTSLQKIQTHCSTKHGWNPKMSSPIYTAVKLQTLAGFEDFRPYFVVQERQRRITPLQSDEDRNQLTKIETTQEKPRDVAPPKQPEFLRFLPKLRVIVCRQHGVCLHSEGIGRHLTEFHPHPQNNEIIDTLRKLGLANNVDSVRTPRPRSQPIEGLPIFRGFECNRGGCAFLSNSQKVMRRHCVAMHNWDSKGQRQPYSCVRMQSLFGRYHVRPCFFTVSVPEKNRTRLKHRNADTPKAKFLSPRYLPKRKRPSDGKSSDEHHVRKRQRLHVPVPTLDIGDLVDPFGGIKVSLRESVPHRPKRILMNDVEAKIAARITKLRSEKDAFQVVVERNGIQDLDFPEENEEEREEKNEQYRRVLGEQHSLIEHVKVKQDRDICETQLWANVDDELRSPPIDQPSLASVSSSTASDEPEEIDNEFVKFLDSADEFDKDPTPADHPSLPFYDC